MLLTFSQLNSAVIITDITSDSQRVNSAETAEIGVIDHARDPTEHFWLYEMCVCRKQGCHK